MVLADIQHYKLFKGDSMLIQVNCLHREVVHSIQQHYLNFKVVMG